MFGSVPLLTKQVTLVAFSKRVLLSHWLSWNEMRHLKNKKKKTSLDANIIRRKHYFLSFRNATIDPEIRQGSSFSLYETSIIISLCNKKSNLCPELKLFSTTQYGVFVFHCVLLFDLGLALSSNNVQAKIA